MRGHRRRLRCDRHGSTGPLIAPRVSSTNPSFVQGIGVQCDLDSVFVGHPQACVDRRRGRTPVLVQLETRSAGTQLLPHRVEPDRVALAEQSDIQWPVIGGLEHPGQMPRAGGHGGGLAALRGAGATADDRRDARAERFSKNLRTDQVDMAVDGARSGDQSIAGDHLGGRTDDEVPVHPGHDVGIAGLADGGDASAPNTEVGLDDSPMVQNGHPGDDGVGGTFSADRSCPAPSTRAAPCRRRTPLRRRLVLVRR